jgi:hypothetical protein
VIVAGVVVARLSADALAKEGYHGLVKCEACDHTERVDPFACFRQGWPEHCGATMVLQKDEAPPSPPPEIK